MKRFLTWTLAATALSIGTYCAYLAVTAARARVEQGLERAEAVTAHAAAALEETEQAMRAARESIS
jgi:hypothetical protein